MEPAVRQNFFVKMGMMQKHCHGEKQKKGYRTTDYIKEGKVDLVVNIPKNFAAEELTNGYLIRRAPLISLFL